MPNQDKFSPPEIIHEGEEYNAPRPEEVRLAILPRVVTKPIVQDSGDISAWLEGYLKA